MDPVKKKFNEAQTRLVIQTADLPLGTLSNMVGKSAIDLVPAFQRRERWNRDKQSSLIESFLLNVPVPPIYLSEEDAGTYTAIDGKQRLRAISDFMHDEYKLRNLERFKEADGYRYSDLPDEVQNALMLRPYMRVVTLLKQTDYELKYDVFLRLNKGGENLNPQEIRNVAFRGKLNDAIYEMAGDLFLRERLKIHDSSSSAYRNMHDAEYVLRFLTLHERYRKFSGSLVQEMDDFMLHNRNADAEEIRRYKQLFSTTIYECGDIWGDIAFKRPEKNGWRDQLLAGMYDAQMLATSFVSEQVRQKAKNSPNKIAEGTKRLFDDEEFETAVRTGTNTPQRIRYRVAKVQQFLENL